MAPAPARRPHLRPMPPMAGAGTVPLRADWSASPAQCLDPELLPDPAEVILAERVPGRAPRRGVLQHLEPGRHLLPTPCRLRGGARRLAPASRNRLAEDALVVLIQALLDQRTLLFGRKAARLRRRALGGQH